MMAAQMTQGESGQRADVGQVLAAIAEHARTRQYKEGPDGNKEPLLSWERVAEYDTFRITVRCDYLMGQS